MKVTIDLADDEHGINKVLLDALRKDQPLLQVAHRTTNGIQMTIAEKFIWIKVQEALREQRQPKLW